MRLLVFDLDGTLTQTGRVDTDCFAAAFAHHGIAPIDCDWSVYEHTTDAGIAAEILRAQLAREPHERDVEPIRGEFCRLLRRALRKQPALFAPVAGAAGLLELLRTDGKQRAAVATGAWRCSAEIKLRAAGLSIVGMPLATSNHGIARTDIVRHAIDCASKRLGRAEFSEIVLIGDAVWDLRTARALGFPFVGVAAEKPTAHLRAAGARHVVGDYIDAQAFFGAVQDAVSDHRTMRGE